MFELAIFGAGMIMGTIVTLGIVVVGSRMNDNGERRSGSRKTAATRRHINAPFARQL